MHATVCMDIREQLCFFRSDFTWILGIGFKILDMWIKCLTHSASFLPPPPRPFLGTASGYTSQTGLELLYSSDWFQSQISLLTSVSPVLGGTDMFTADLAATLRTIVWHGLVVILYKFSEHCFIFFNWLFHSATTLLQLEFKVILVLDKASGRIFA